MSVVVHTHESEDEGGILDNTAFRFAEFDLSGTVGPASTVSVSLGSTGFVFFPMFYADSTNVHVAGHLTDGASPDEPRCAFYNFHVSLTRNYALSYRKVFAS